MAERLKYRASQGFLLLVASFFALQIFSPLRLNTDAITLLSMAESAAHGGGFLDGGQRTVFPPGYPALLTALMSLGVCHSWTIIGLNLAFLSVGLLATYYLLLRDFVTERFVCLLVCAFFLLSFVVVKHVAIALTDVPFFCCAMCCLAVMSAAVKRSGWRLGMLAGAAWLLAITAITVRRTGVALVPPLVLLMLRTPNVQSFRQSSRWIKLGIAAVVGFTALVTTYVVANTSTLAGSKLVSADPKWLHLLSDVIFYRLTELGELLINVPLSRIPTLAELFVPMVGLILLFLVVFGASGSASLGARIEATAKPLKIGLTEVFLACYMMILFVWPYYDTRFWLPVAPLLIGYSVLSVRHIKFIHPVFVALYCMVFAVIGFAGIAYSTGISLAGASFPDRYGDGALRPTYCAAFRSCRDGGEPTEVNAKALHLLREYN